MADVDDELDIAGVEDDFSPEDAFNMFTPSIYRPGAKDRPDFVLPPSFNDHGVDPYTIDTRGSGGLTESPLGGGPPFGVAIPPPPQHRVNNATLADFFPPSLSADDNRHPWIVGQREDAVLLPVVLTAIGLCAVLGNILLLLTIAGLRRLRSGPNLMLANVALADLVFVAVTVPVAVVNHATKSLDEGSFYIGPRLCRFAYYVIFVTVYVSVYTLVVSSVFRFFGELLGGRKRRRELQQQQQLQQAYGKPPPGSIVIGLPRHDHVKSGGAAPASGAAGSVPLSTCSALVSCVVVWVAFAASHLTFVVQSDVTGLAAFERPVICVYGPPGMASVPSSSGDVSRVRTLWVTFLACAFLLPLTIVLLTSACVLKMQRRAFKDAGQVSFCYEAYQLFYVNSFLMS